jgi:hypothetical protein
VAKKYIPSAKPPTLRAYEIPGQLLVQEALRKADDATRRPRADYARGSDLDRGVGSRR